MLLKKTPPWNVLVFPAASEVAFEIARALGSCKEVVLHGAQQPGLNLGAFHFRRLHALPRIEDPACLPALQALIAAEKIDAIFPAYDDVLLWLVESAPRIAATVLAPPKEACVVTRSKRETYKHLAALLPVPRLGDTAAEVSAFPVFVKPDRGQGSQRARRIDDRAELERAVAAEPDLLIMENLSGQEYTIDCFSQNGGGVLYAGARSRTQIKHGIAVLTETTAWPHAQEWAEKISTAFHLRGAWFFQVKENAKGQPHLLEVAPRIAGSMGLSQARGLNLPLLTLYEAAGHDLALQPINGAIRMGRSLDVRFRDERPVGALYVDLDDTLIVRGEVNGRLVALVFQCRNRGIPVILITRHKADLEATLAAYHLAGIFDRVVHLSDDTVSKAAFIHEKEAVLIDDSFRERAAVTRQLGLRCYDAAGAMCLLDERV